MTQYIDKNALVAVIRKRLLPAIRDKHYDEWEEGQNSERIAILDIIDTFEVKEVDSTDIFIEKACKGIDHLLSGYIIRNFHFGDSYDIDRLIEDFRNYMKEE